MKKIYGKNINQFKFKVNEIQKYFVVLIFLMVVSSSNISYGDISDREANNLIVGVLSFDEKEETLEKWTPLVQYLNETLPKYKFELIPLYYEEMNKAVYNCKVDFAFTNPGHFIELKASSNISRAIATLIETEEGVPQSEFGGVIFTKSSNTSIDSLVDIKGKTISAVSKSSLGGYQASAYELAKVGIDLDRDVDFIYTGMPHKNIIESVLNGSSDVGFIRTGIIEHLVLEGDLDIEDIEVVNLIKRDNFSDYLSTELYPEWPFSAISHIDMDTYRDVAMALLKLSSESEEARLMDIHGFNIPSSYLAVEEMMRELKLPPFDKNSKLTIDEVWNSYRAYMVLFGVALLIALFVAVLKVITEREIRRKNQELHKLTEELNEVSIRDPLTKLYNRRYFEIFFIEKTNLAKRSNSSIGLLLIDVDLFKDVNDTYGHMMGDEVLKEIASTISEQVMRATDFVVRFGGDEFIVVLYDTNMEGTLKVANRIHNAVGQVRLHCDNLDEYVSVTVSIGGVNILPKVEDSCEMIIEIADKAMYEAKDRGRNQVNVVDVGLN